MQIKDAIFKTLNANGMFNNAHIRLTLTRGKKVNYRYRLISIVTYSVYLQSFFPRPYSFSSLPVLTVGYIWNESYFQSVWVCLDWYKF
jgi:hypothetical protein